MAESSKSNAQKKARVINPTDISKLLEKDSNHDKFFYLYVATSGSKKEKEQTEVSPAKSNRNDDAANSSISGVKKGESQNEATPDNYNQDDDYSEDDSDRSSSESSSSESESDKESESASVAQTVTSRKAESLDPTEKKKEEAERKEEEAEKKVEEAEKKVEEAEKKEEEEAEKKKREKAEKKKNREEAMKDVHRKLPKHLYNNGGWQKVQDKDKQTSYRALYFNTIEKEPGEDGIAHMLKVNEHREKIKEFVEKIRQDHGGVNFKIDCLLSRPLFYDKKALEDRQK